MKKYVVILSLLIFSTCQNFGQIHFEADLPFTLSEVSGITTVPNSDLIWMINDSNNRPILFGVNSKGKTEREILVNAKNIDWEDLTSDVEGNIYIGDFGNNENERKNLRILKIDKKYLDKKTAEVEEIEFEYEDQDDFPPKKKKRFFDAESFFYFKNHFYIFTKSRVDKKYGETNVYSVPAKKGKHKAKRIDNFDNGKKDKSWITSASISAEGNKVVLLSQKNVLIFSDFKKDKFFKGKRREIDLKFYSQLEAICFKDATTVFITDERNKDVGGNLYTLNLEN